MLRLSIMRSVAQVLLNFHQKLHSSRHRRLVLLDGTIKWQDQLIAELLTGLSSQPELKWLCYGKEFSEYSRCITSNYRYHLGTENDVVVFADETFHPDAFAALSGTLVAGGLLLWCCQRTKNTDLFRSRLLKHAVNDKDVIRITENDSMSELSQILAAVHIEHEDVQAAGEFRFNCLNAEQERVVTAIMKVASGHRNRPLVLTADRGRGKSSTLANACCELVNQGDRKHDIVITAPHSAAVAIFFSQLADVLDLDKQPNLSIEYKQHTIRFVPVDTLLSQPEVSVSLLLVDEAAGIPVYLLESLLLQYHRTVFSSTVHGYEGAGRGFAISFDKCLRQFSPQYCAMQLTKPIRWGDSDPLERFVFDGFCLNAVLPELDEVDGDSLVFSAISREMLYNNEAMLNDVLALLVTAHYQTSPSDLKLILNNDHVHVFVAHQNEQLVAAVLAVSEGDASSKEINDVESSRRQLKDQFLPQALFRQCGLASAFKYRYLRVMRIAVHPLRQRRKIGQALLAFVEQQVKRQQVDIIGTSFGATSDLVQFWHSSELVPVRLGVQKDKSSGQHSVIMLKGLNSSATTFVKQASELFFTAMPYLLGNQFSHLPSSLIISLYKAGSNICEQKVAKHDLEMIRSFAYGQRQIADCKFSISNWLPVAITQSTGQDFSLLLEVVWQHKPVDFLQRSGKTQGKKQLSKQLQAIIKKALSHSTPP